MRRADRRPDAAGARGRVGHADGMDADGTAAVRRAGARDFEEWFALFEAVAAEGRWIGREAPLDRAERRAVFERSIEADDALSLVAEMDGRLVGALGANLRRGVAELGMFVGGNWRGHGVGSALLASFLDWATELGAHKAALQVWPHNEAAIALYEKFGFLEEGRLRRHYRRRNGELWDAIEMGRVLDETSPGSPYGRPEGCPEARVG